MFLTGTVSFLVAFAILGQDDKDQLTAESVKEFTVRISSVDKIRQKKNSLSELSDIRMISQPYITCFKLKLGIASFFYN